MVLLMVLRKLAVNQFLIGLDGLDAAQSLRFGGGDQSPSFSTILPRTRAASDLPGNPDSHQQKRNEHCGNVIERFVACVLRADEWRTPSDFGFGLK